jgi:hypothetical protein
MPRSHLAATRRSEFHAATRVVTPELPAGNSNLPHCVAASQLTVLDGHVTETFQVTLSGWPVQDRYSLFSENLLAWSAIRLPRRGPCHPAKVASCQSAANTIGADSP